MKVIISHSEQDSALAQRIAQGLKDLGVSVWIDDDYSGENWAAARAKALENAEAMVVLLTPNALQSRYVGQDVLFALGKKQYKRRVVPVFVGSRRSDVGGEVPWMLKRFEGIDFGEYESERDAVRELANYLSGSISPQAMQA